MSQLHLKLFVLVFVLTLVYSQDCSQRQYGNQKKCCNFPRLIEKSTWRSCKSENRVKRYSGRRGGPDSCSMECMFKALGIIENGVVQRSTLVSSLTASAAGNQALLDSINRAITTCVNSNGTPTAIALPADPGTPSCSINAAAIYDCIKRQVILNCPAALATTSDACTSFLAYIAACPTPTIT